MANQTSVAVHPETMMRLANLQGMITEMINHGKTRNSFCLCIDGQEKGIKYKRCYGKDLNGYLDDFVKNNT